MIDILEIRDRLNALPFRDGKRQVLIGRLSDSFPVVKPATAAEDDGRPAEPARDPAVRAHLDQLAESLAAHDLELVRGLEDSDELFAVQSLRTQTEIDMSWMAAGVNWVSRITTAALEMVIPGLIGIWLDERLGTGFIGLLGFALGITVGLWHLIKMTQQPSETRVTRK